MRPRGVLAAAAMMLAMTGCGLFGDAVDNADKGDCVKKDGDSFEVVQCDSGAEYVVLDKLDGAKCESVAGVTYAYSKGTVDLCLGTIGADTARAANVAQRGDCLTDAQTPEKTPCDAPDAKFTILERKENASNLAISQPCAKVPGSSDSYTWSLKSDTAIANLTDDVLFCLGPVGVDPAKSVDTAQPGDCLRKTGGTPELERTDCGATDVYAKVLHREDNTFLTPELACRTAPATTSTLKRDLGLEGYILCLGEV